MHVFYLIFAIFVLASSTPSFADTLQGKAHKTMEQNKQLAGEISDKTKGIFYDYANSFKNLNINSVTVKQLTEVGIPTPIARKIISFRNRLPGKLFESMDQVHQAIDKTYKSKRKQTITDTAKKTVAQRFYIEKKTNHERKK
jgi:hypothetical protein